MHNVLRKSFLVPALALGAAFINADANAGPADVLKWKSVIGLALPLNVVGTGTGAVTGGGLPWSALGGQVRVDLADGYINFSVEGLAFAGGNSIGTPGTVEQIKGTLVCDTSGVASGGNSVLVDTPLVELDDHGDAHFGGHVGPLPHACNQTSQIAFLIRLGTNRWIASGTVLR